MRARRAILVLLVVALPAAIAAAVVLASTGGTKAPPVTLRVVVPSGQGTISAGTRTCASACDWQFPKGSRVQLRARGAMGFGFVAWGGACTRTKCIVVLKRTRAVSARFAPLPRELSWNAHTKCRPLVTTLAHVVGSAVGPYSGALESGGGMKSYFKTGYEQHQLKPP